MATLVLAYTYAKKFDGLEPVEHTFRAEVEHRGGLHEASLQHAFGIGLKNMCDDSMAGKGDDPAEAREALVAKILRIEAGDVRGANRGPRLTDEERHERDVVDGIIRDNLKPGAAFPKKEMLEAAREAVRRVAADAINAEVARRMKKAIKVELPF